MRHGRGLLIDHRKLIATQFAVQQVFAASLTFYKFTFKLEAYFKGSFFNSYIRIINYFKKSN